MDRIVRESQADIRRGYCSSGTGRPTSARAGALDAGNAVSRPAQGAVGALGMGGMLVRPLHMLCCRLPSPCFTRATRDPHDRRVEAA